MARRMAMQMDMKGNLSWLFGCVGKCLFPCPYGGTIYLSYVVQPGDMLAKLEG